MKAAEFGMEFRQCRKIVCVGLNYHDHAKEAGLEPPSSPVLFGKWSTSLIGSGQPIHLPEESNAVDFEGELAVVIGRKGRDIPEQCALDYVGGYGCFNDVTARDIQAAEGQWSRAKSFDSFGPLSRIVPRSQVPDVDDLLIRTFLNGELMQSGSTADMIFAVTQLIAVISRNTTLEPGDIIATGTPPGIGYARTPPRLLASGDVVRVEIDGVGFVENPVK